MNPRLIYSLIDMNNLKTMDDSRLNMIREQDNHTDTKNIDGKWFKIQIFLKEVYVFSKRKEDNSQLWNLQSIYMSLVNLMVSIKKYKKPFKNTKIRPAENVTRVEVGSPNPRWVVLGRPRGSSNPRWSTRAGSSARVVQPTLVYPRQLPSSSLLHPRG